MAPPALPQPLNSKKASTKSGLIVGCVGQRVLRFNQQGYALVIAKTGPGKGAGIVIPNLLTYRGSCIVMDIKGENAAITARARGAFGAVHHMNLEQPFISALILHVLERQQDKAAFCALMQVRSLTAQSESEFLELMQDMAERSFIGFVRDTAMDFISMDCSLEMKSIRSTMEKTLRLWNSASPVAYVTCRSDFDLMTFTHTPQMLFLSVPEEKLGTYGRFLRVMQGCALMATTRAAKTQVPPEHPCSSCSMKRRHSAIWNPSRRRQAI